MFIQEDLTLSYCKGVQPAHNFLTYNVLYSILPARLPLLDRFKSVSQSKLFPSEKTCLTINWVNTSRDNDNSNREHLPEASWCLLRLDLAPLSDNLVLRVGLWLLRAMHKVTFALVVSLN